MTITAVFIPGDDTVLSAAMLAKATGMRLYTNGKQSALLPQRLPGWFPVGVVVKNGGQLDACEETNSTRWVSICA